MEKIYFMIMTAIAALALAATAVTQLHALSISPGQNLSISNAIAPGGIPSAGAACAEYLGPESKLHNYTGMTNYTWSRAGLALNGFIIKPNTTGTFVFKISNVANRTIDLTTYFDMRHAEKAALVNYTAGTRVVECTAYPETNGTYLPTTCHNYTESSGYYACYKSFTGSSECMNTYSNSLPPQSINMTLSTHPGLVVSITPKNESIAPNSYVYVKATVQVLPGAPEGTYLAAMPAQICGGAPWFLLTIGTSPYNGTVRFPPAPA